MASTVLVVTALEDVTADRVIAALNEREVPVARVDPAGIGAGLAFGARIGAGAPAWTGRLVTGSREVELGEVAAVYYRRPTPYAARFQHLPAQQRDFAAAEARHGWFRKRERTTFVDGFVQHFGDQHRGNVDENRQRFGRLPGPPCQPRLHLRAGVPAAAARG
ncbi:MvdC/MvdD family ATP grasp protein [Streptomyces neyagawaensis]|uniref:MvdC/MvdD family ATP grasp protein n=1 Tax=Streptomyces neyagawaensis TaxID=42238 RepID=UPI0006E1D0F5|nr:hypothetical protein [Streptomyces neyagawaensis]MCL6737428.1 hypothetical protein [Streptomyces neyagawaensis]